jgi:hypothetical protein
MKTSEMFRAIIAVEYSLEVLQRDEHVVNIQLVVFLEMMKAWGERLRG